MLSLSSEFSVGEGASTPPSSGNPPPTQRLGVRGLLLALADKINLRNMPIRRKLLTVTLVVALLISIVSLGGFRFVTSQYDRMIYTQTAGSLSVISNKTASRLDNLMESSLHTAVNREFQSTLSILNQEQYSSAKKLAHSKITSILYRTMHSDMITVSVYPSNSNPIDLGLYSSSKDENAYSIALAKAYEAKGAPVWVSANKSDGSILLARQIRNVDEPFLDEMGVLVIRVDLDNIVKESAKNALYGPYSITLTQNSEHLYPYLPDQPAHVDSPVFQGDIPYTIDQKNGERFFVIHTPIDKDRLNWEMLLSIPYSEIFHSLMITNALFWISLVVAVVLSILLSRRMLVSIHQDIRLLSNKMDRVRQGDLDPYPNPADLGKDELGTLNRHFDKMTGDFKQVINDNYVKELLLTQTQLKALKQQINPHFLYNSLESISWFARSGDGHHVSSIAHSLGHLLRSTLTENDDCIPLREELDILNSYLSIQSLRFPDTLRVHLQVDDSTLEIMIPKMSVQPLVENAIVHSLEENIGVCHIYLRIVLENGNILVEVENNGSEIDQDILSKLREKTVQPKGNGIGLTNIDSRIKLLFGSGYGIKLESREDHVIASYKIPAVRSEDITNP